MRQYDSKLKTVSLETMWERENFSTKWFNTQFNNFFLKLKFLFLKIHYKSECNPVILCIYLQLTKWMHSLPYLMLQE